MGFVLILICWVCVVWCVFWLDRTPLSFRFGVFVYSCYLLTVCLGLLWVTIYLLVLVVTGLCSCLCFVGLFWLFGFGGYCLMECLLRFAFVVCFTILVLLIVFSRMLACLTSCLLGALFRFLCVF